LKTKKKGQKLVYKLPEAVDQNGDEFEVLVQTMETKLQELIKFDLEERTFTMNLDVLGPDYIGSYQIRIDLIDTLKASARFDFGFIFLTKNSCLLIISVNLKPNRRKIISSKKFQKT